MKIVILNGSPRVKGNTAAMVEYCGIVTSDNTTNKTESKLNECYQLGKDLK